jgi:hypothetical protein
MSRIKNTLLNDLTQEELERMLYERYNDDSDYNKWLESEEFVEFVNGEIQSTKPVYSEYDVMNSIRYASNQIQIEPSEVGKEVYDMLFSEKIQEYLNSHRNGF